MQSYHAHGKLLLTAEYTVLKGALALAIPTKFGQRMTVETSEKPGLFWQSFDLKNQLWFHCTFSPDLELTACDDADKATFLQDLLKAAQALSGGNFSLSHQQVKTHLEFPNDWGLGSSSTLISLIAQWFAIEPLELFFKAAKGSGYDVACATAEGPIRYQLHAHQKASIQSTTLPKAFDAIKFIHLNQKQRSLPEVKRFMHRETDYELIKDISALTLAIEEADDEISLCNLFNQHEVLTAKAIGLETIKQRLFPDFSGCIKSLGAWGGDFVLAIGSETDDYFKQKAYRTILNFQEMILAQN